MDAADPVLPLLLHPRQGSQPSLSTHSSGLRLPVALQPCQVPSPRPGPCSVSGRALGSQDREGV